jgi:MFS family permease
MRGLWDKDLMGSSQQDRLNGDPEAAGGEKEESKTMVETNSYQIASSGKDSLVDEPKPRSFFLTALPFYILAHCAHHLLTALPMPLLPFIRSEFGLGYRQASYVTSSFALANGAGQLPAGWLADRFGPTKLIMVGILGVALAGILVGSSQTYVMLLISLVVMGLLAGGYHPAATPLISESVEPNQQGRALGFHLIGGNTAFFLGPVVAGTIAGIWGWRVSFIGLAVPTAIFGLIFYFYLRRRFSKANTPESKRGSSEEKPPPPGNIRRMVAFLTMSVLGGGAGMSTTAFIPLYAVDRLGSTEATAASLLSIVFFSGLWVAPVGGYISDRIGRVPIIIFGGIVSGTLIYFLPLASWGLSFFAILFFIGLVNAMRMPVSEAFIMGQVSSGRRSTIFGIYYFTMQYTGAVFAPILGGLIDRWGFDLCFNVAGSTVVVVTLLCSFFLRGSQ